MGMVFHVVPIISCAEFLTSIFTAQKMKFSIEDSFSKCDQIHSFLCIWSHLLKKSRMESLIFCVVFSKVNHVEFADIALINFLNDFLFQIAIKLILLLVLVYCNTLYIYYFLLHVIHLYFYIYLYFSKILCHGHM